MTVTWCPFAISCVARHQPILPSEPVMVIFIVLVFCADKTRIVLTFVQVRTLKYVTMSTIKESSTIQANKKVAFVECPITHVMEKIGGYWKPIILFNLLSGEKRYGELRRSVPAITEKVLIQQLKQLETDGLIARKAMQVVPPHVTYALTPSGQRLET